MSALTRQSDSPLETTGWEAGVLQLLEEQHLAAWSLSGGLRVSFAVGLVQFLQGLHEAEVYSIYGRFVTDLDSFCYQLERLLPGPRLDRRIDGPRGVTALLRERASFPGRPAGRFRFYIWHDADVLLSHDAKLFGRLVDAMAGVAAEAEYVSDDLLLIQRLVLVGGRPLRAYAADPRGQCRCWYQDGLGEPFWRVVTGVDRPRFQLVRIEGLRQVR